MSTDLRDGPPSQGDGLNTVDEVAVRLGLTRDTVYRYVRSGLLDSVRLGGPQGRVRIPDAAVERFVRPVACWADDPAYLGPEMRRMIGEASRQVAAGNERITTLETEVHRLRREVIAMRGR